MVIVVGEVQLSIGTVIEPFPVADIAGLARHSSVACALGVSVGERLASIDGAANRVGGKLEVGDVHRVVEADLNVGVAATEHRADLRADRECPGVVVTGPEADSRLAAPQRLRRRDVHTAVAGRVDGK